MCFPNAHPSEISFIEKMQEHSKNRADRLNDIRKSKVIPYEIEEFNLPVIPLSYINFSVPDKVKSKGKTGKRKRK